MGNSDSKADFRGSFEVLIEHNLSASPKGKELVDRILRHADVANLVDAEEVRALYKKQFANLTMLLDEIVRVLIVFPRQPSAAQLPTVLNAVSMLTRLMTFLMEKYRDAELFSFWWAPSLHSDSLTGSMQAASLPPETPSSERNISNRSANDDSKNTPSQEPDRSLEANTATDKITSNNTTIDTKTTTTRGDTSRAHALLVAVGQLLFTQGVCVPDGNVSSRSPMDDRVDALDESLLWAPGAASHSKPSKVPSSTATLDKNRTALVRLLLVLFSQVLFMPSRNSFAGSCRNPWLAFATSSRFPFRRQLFVSLVNVSLSFQLPNVVSATITGTPSDELPTLASQCLCVLLDFGSDPGTDEHVFSREVNAAAAAAERLTLQRIAEAKAASGGTTDDLENADVIIGEGDEDGGEEGDADDDGQIPGNTFRLIAREFTSDARDCVFVFEAIRRMLTGHVSQDSGMLRRPKLRFVQQILVLLWRLVNDSKTFLAQMLKEPDINEITSSLCYLLWYARTDPRQTGIAHVCTFLLLLLSGERNFAIMLNRPLSAPMSLRDGPLLNTNCTHADLLVVVIHKVLVSASSALRDLANCYLTIACNVSSLCKRLSMASSVRLVKLLDTFSTPRFLFANANNHTLLETVIEILNNLVQYQYDGNSQLIYALCLNSKVVDRISRLELPKSNGSIATDQTDAVSEHSDASSFADSIVDKFVPTRVWFNSWWPKLQLGTLQRLLNCLKPQVEELCKLNRDDTDDDRRRSIHAVDVVSTRGGGGSKNVDENTILEFLKESTMVGLLPVPHPIIVRRYTPNEFTDLWFMTYLWGTIFLDSQNQHMPLWSGRYLRLFDVTGGS